MGDNMLYDYLVNNYEKGEPIFLMDIVIKGMTEENIRYLSLIHIYSVWILCIGGIEPAYLYNQSCKRSIESKTYD